MNYERNRVHERRVVLFSDEFMFCLHHQGGHIRVWRHSGELTLVACNCHRHTDASPGVMVRDDTGCMSRSPLVCLDCSWNSARYISFVLPPVALSLMLDLQNPSFKQDDRIFARPHDVGILRTFFDTENFQLLLWPVHSPDHSQIENVWFIVTERLARFHMLVITVD
ncbi:transposable element Tcb1 transposase [Trichonephila clavipes]|uniref:Transposable element Tcb1 transposase n=1 Tax=Trichonephila clavipes TaxID=2585209 RepID=A0A8X6W2W3_TRICX|nr:transposable element Tcb1 transposase [Trichonephila clavipes]